MVETKRITAPWVRQLRHELYGEHEAEFEAKGKMEGKREALLAVLEGRGLSIPQVHRAAILRCKDLAMLDRWISGSGKAASVRELLAVAPALKKNGARNGAVKHRAHRAG